MEVTLIRVHTGFAPADDEAIEAMRHFPIGSVARLDVKLMRNYQFFKKWWALVKLGYDHFAEMAPEEQFKGKPVLPNFERFRKDVTIMAGFYAPVWNARNEMRVEAESLNWGSMTEERFTKLYDATIRVLLREVFKNRNLWNEERLRDVVERVERFAA